AIEPTVAKPHSPDNRATARECHGIKLDRAYIGSCTGGKLNDFVAAATILKGHQVLTDTYIVPATTEVARGLATTRLNGETLLEPFQKAGAKIAQGASCAARSEEHTSELQSRVDLVCRLLLEKKKIQVNT